MNPEIHTDSTIEYQYTDLSKEIYFFLVYEATRQLEFKINQAKKNVGLVFILDEGVVSEKHLVISFPADKIVFAVPNVPNVEMRVYAEEFYEMIMYSVEQSKKNLSPEQITAGINQMNNKLFADSDEYIGQNISFIRTEKQGLLSGLLPTKGNFVAPILIMINVLVFVLMIISGVSVFSPSIEDVVKWGADWRPLTFGGQWWRLITSNYLHGGLLHIAFNMYALFYIGRILEQLLGKARFITAYTVSGIFGSLASVAWDANAVSVGASGAIFGVHGVFLALLTTNLLEKEIRQAFLKNMLVFVGLNLFIGMSAGFDNAAHIGGLVSGFVLGYILLPGIKKPMDRKLKYITIGFSFIIVIVSAILLGKNLKMDFVLYDQKMEQFSKLEAEALTVYSLPDTTELNRGLDIIYNKGTKNWINARILLKEIDKLELPESRLTRNKQLIEYCSLHITSCNLFYLAAKNQSKEFNDKIKENDEKIKMILTQLNTK